MRSKIAALTGALLTCSAGLATAQYGTGFDPSRIQGPGSDLAAADPTFRKWYVPQELYSQYGWEQWRYSNYARQQYQRYTNVALEGSRLYDIYGNYITRGWRIYDWSQDQPRAFGSTVYKDPRFGSWFSNLLVSSSTRGQFYTALTIGEEIRTTLTPLTFSKPTFNGVQWDFLSDKYAVSIIASRASDPAKSLQSERFPPLARTDIATLIGGRATAQVGDFVTVGGAYANVFLGRSLHDWADNSMKGKLTTDQNGQLVREITIRLRDDSPEDGEGGALLFSQSIFIDGRRADISPAVRGGTVKKGRREASGPEEIFLTYNLEGWSYVNEDQEVRDVNWFRRVTFNLVVANDYRIEVTSNSQLDHLGQEVFLPVAAAEKNVKDATNQQVVRFDYGLPTGNEIYSATFELEDLYGFWLRSEFALNRRHRRFPNANTRIRDHTLASEKSNAWYVSAQRLFYPWFAYAEAFSMDPEYSTTMYVPDQSGIIDYSNEQRYWFEMVEDNDDQDRLPDWIRKADNQRSSNEVAQVQRRLGGVYPGLDANNDFISDFNQNDNFTPDYDEPFLRYVVDPPEYLFGVDMNNNTVVDRFENDLEADYPYKRDHQGYNAYVGGEIARGVRVLAGRFRENLISTDRRNRAWYALLTSEQDMPAGVWRLFEYIRSVKDDIPENLEIWEVTPGTRGTMVAFADPLVARDTWINTLYSDFTYTGLGWATIVNKIKYERYSQREERPGLKEVSEFLGIVNRGHTSYQVSSLKLTPKFKSRYGFRSPFEQGGRRRKELSETLTLLAMQPVTASSSVEFGIEYTAFFNLLDKDAVRAAAQEDDFQGLVLATEYTNRSAYLGYALTSKVGFRQETRYFKDITRTGNVIFIQVFAGLEN